MTDRVDINRVLLEMRALKSQTQAFSKPEFLAGEDRLVNGLGRDGIQQTNGPKFADLMSQAINKVNEVQQASGAMSKAYLHGDPKVDITDVMIASQKAGVAFDAMVQVRNKLVEAYRDVMNMPI